MVTEYVTAAEPGAHGSEAALAAVPGAEAQRSRRGVVVVLVALGAGLLVHLPGLFRPLFDSDEAAIATLGAGITRGGTLYRDLIDRKPPLAPLLYAVSFLVTGSHSIVTLRVILGLEIGIAALVIGYEAVRITGSRTSGWWAGGLLVLGAVAFRPVAGQAANYSQLALLPGCVAIVASRHGTRRAALVGGLALGLAVLTRQTWLLGLAPALLGVWSHGGRRIERLAVLVATMALTIGAVGMFMPFSRVLALDVQRELRPARRRSVAAGRSTSAGVARAVRRSRTSSRSVSRCGVACVDPSSTSGSGSPWASWHSPSGSDSSTTTGSRHSDPYVCWPDSPHRRCARRCVGS